MLNLKSKLTKCFCCAHTDDQCFYVGLGQRGQSQSARKANFLGSDEYRPFQCCPTKLERATKVPKMTAQRLAQSKSNDRKPGKQGNFHFADVTPKPVAKAPKEPKSPKKSSEVTTKETKPDTTRKGAATKAKAEKGQKGQKGLLGIGKVVNWL